MKRLQPDIPALYYPQIMEINAVVALSPEETQHLRALRRHAGDRVLLLDGQGTRGEGVIDGFRRDSVTVCIDSIVLDEAQSTPYIALGLAILADKARYEWCIEKGVEL